MTKKFYDLKKSKNFTFKKIDLPKYYFLHLKHSVDTLKDLARYRFIISNIKNDNNSIKKYINLSLEWKKNES